MIRLEPVKVEGYDECNDMIFSAECFDEYSADIKIMQTVNTPESWNELACAIQGALEMLCLKK
jgi:hypothetical protein